MPNTIRHKRASTTGKVPLTTDLQLGELAINTFDGRLYTKKDNGTASVVEIGAPNVSYKVFTTSGVYVPSANAKSIIVYLTGAGGAGGAVNSSSTAGTAGGGAGSGGGTLIFSMPVNSSQSYQIAVGAATATTASGTSVGANGSNSQFGILTGGGGIQWIAIAPGGVGGASANGAGLQNGAASATISAPASGYVPASNYLGIRGGNGGGPMLAYAGSTAQYGGIQTGTGGGSYWGPGAASTSSQTGLSTVNTVLNGAAAAVYGGGGSGGAKYQKTGTAASATGGAGAQGVCVIIEVTN